MDVCVWLNFKADTEFFVCCFSHNSHRFKCVKDHHQYLGQSPRIPLCFLSTTNDLLQVSCSHCYIKPLLNSVIVVVLPYFIQFVGQLYNIVFFFFSTARGRLEGNHDMTSVLLSGPLAPDPVLYPGCYSARTPANRPRIGPNATHILERGQRGVVGELLKLDGVSITPVPKQSKCIEFVRSANLVLIEYTWHV